MKRFLSTTTALSLALTSAQPWPLLAQVLAEDGSVLGPDGSVLCAPTAEAACNPEAYVEQANAIAAAMAEAAAAAEAEAAAAAQAAAEAAAAAQAAAEAEAAAAAQAAAEAEAAAAAQAAAEAEAAAAAQAAAEAEAAAAAQAAAEAEAAAAAQAEAAAAEAEAAAAAAAAEADAANAAKMAEEEARMNAEAEAAAAAEVEAEAAAKATAAEEEARLKAEEEAAAAAQAAADAEAAAAAAAQAAADAAVAAQAAEEEARLKAEADAAAAAQAAADAEAAAKAAADAEAAAAAATDDEARKKAEEEAAAAALAAEEAAKAAADAEAAAAAAADEQTRLKAEQDAAEAEAAKAATDASSAAAQAAADEAARVQAELDAAKAAEGETTPGTEEVQRTDEAAVDPVTGEPEKTAEELVIDAAALEAATQELAIEADGTMVDPAAGLKTEEVVIDPNAVPVEAPVVTEVEVESLAEIMSQPDALAPTALEAAATLVPAPEAKADEPVALQPLAEAPPSAEAVATVTQVLTEADTRSSANEFAAAPVQVAPGKKDRLSDLEKVGLFALGALVVGAIITENNKGKQEKAQVVSNTGDRVIILKPDGTYQVYKDDDAVLRRPGSTVRTETFKDGSTRTIVEREDGTQVVTIRDASGRVLRRAQYDRLGHEIVLIDDLEVEEVVIIKDLPKPKKKVVVISSQDEDAALKAKLAAKEAKKAGRKFSLRQVREIPEVRALAATIDVSDVTFDSGSAAIKATEAENLAELGGLMQELIEANPAEVFLIEGHTDATGKAAMNLALSDRRAESVALALSEYFDIPPENMIVQGYGESELLIDTQKDERKNRRVAVRIITPLLKISE